MREQIFVARRSTKRLLALLALLLLLSVFLLLVPVEISKRLELVARIVGGLGLLTCLVRIFSAIRRPVEEIRVSSAGIFYRPWSDQTIAWDQIGIVRLNVPD